MDLAADPTPFFSYFKDAKNLFTRRHLSSVLKIKFFANIFLLFLSAQHLYEKREGSGAGSLPLANGSGSGRPKNMRIWIAITVFGPPGSVSGSGIYLYGSGSFHQQVKNMNQH
jgi:hypothetical protein